jgi:hypothetical protein
MNFILNSIRQYSTNKWYNTLVPNVQMSFDNIRH